MSHETNKPNLSALIDQAQNKVPEPSQNNLYLIPHPTGLWHAALSDTPPASNAALLTPEHAYPATLYYARIDLNGSSCIECNTCKNAQELLSLLDWIGLCSFIPLQLWDYDHNKSLSHELLAVLDAAADRRHMLAQNELHAFEEDMPSDFISSQFSHQAPERN